MPTPQLEARFSQKNSQFYFAEHFHKFGSLNACVVEIAGRTFQRFVFRARSFGEPWRNRKAWDPWPLSANVTDSQLRSKGVVGHLPQ